MRLIRLLATGLFAAGVWASPSDPALEKIAPTLWRAMADQPQGTVAAIVTIKIAAAEAVVSPESKRLAAIAEAGQEVGQEVTLLGGEVTARWSHIPALACRLPAAALPYLAAHPRVAHIGPDRQVRAFDLEGEALINVPQVRSLGWTGQGVGIAMLDTGVDYNHPDLSPGGTSPSAKTVLLWDAINNDADPLDDEGHGTATASVAAGKTLGVAQAGRIVAVKVLNDKGSGSISHVLTGLNKVLQSIDGGNPYNIRAVNLSLGGYNEAWPPGSGSCDELDPATFSAFASLRQRGVVITVAAGNGGCTNGVAWPACLSNALAVGAVYDANIGRVSFDQDQCIPLGCTDFSTAADQVACYSDSGEELDLWAPGGATMAARKGGGVESFHGTSMAAPYVAGVAALLAQAKPQASSQELFNALRGYGQPITDPRNGITRNRVDSLAALQALQGGAASYSQRYYLTGIARWPGVPPAFWYSDVAILNRASLPVHLRLTFLSDTASPAPVELTLDANAQASWRDVLAQAFGLTTNAVGAILVEADQPVRVLARTYSQVQVKQQDSSLAWGTMGQFIEGVEVSKALVSGKAGYLSGLRSDPPFRTNVEFLNVGSSDVQVEVAFFANNGSAITTLVVDIPAQRRVQVAKALPDGHQSAYARVRVLTPGGQVVSLASVVDGNSTDPTTIPLWVP